MQIGKEKGADRGVLMRGLGFSLRSQCREGTRLLTLSVSFNISSACFRSLHPFLLISIIASMYFSNCSLSAPLAGLISTLTMLSNSPSLSDSSRAVAMTAFPPMEWPTSATFERF